MVYSLLVPLLKGKQFVIVEFYQDMGFGKTLVFLVDDVESPKVPGYPAQGIAYFADVETARQAIGETYKTINYWPKNNGYQNVYRRIIPPPSG